MVSFAPILNLGGATVVDTSLFTGNVALVSASDSDVTIPCNILLNQAVTSS
jgi:hypothetical protein